MDCESDAPMNDIFIKCFIEGRRDAKHNQVFPLTVLEYFKPSFLLGDKKRPNSPSRAENVSTERRKASNKICQFNHTEHTNNTT